MAEPRRLAAVALLAAWVLGCGGGGSPEGLPPLAERPSVLLIVTDDQRWDTLFAVPAIRAALGDRGAVFERAFVTNPVCCPFRASLLSGGFYSRHTGVLAALPPNGAAVRFDDRRTLGTLLQQRGYRTALIGKYMNRLKDIAPRVPPGWDRFLAATDVRDWWNTGYLAGNTASDRPGTGERIRADDYITDFEAAAALDFLAAAEPGEPFFLYLAFNAPHRPAVAPPADERRWGDYTYRARSWGEEDVSDKPSWVRRRADRFLMPGEGDRVGDPRMPQSLPAHQLASLRPVDRAVQRILAELEARGVADETVVIFTSDNGMMWGEHRLMTKAMPYEEAIRVPLLVRYPGLPPAVIEGPVAVNLDVAATVLELAGVELAGDGESLLPLLADPSAPGRERIFLHSAGVPSSVPAWAGVRTDRWKYIEYVTGERELYDLVADPLEFTNLASDPPHAERMAELAELLAPEKGLAAVTSELPAAVVGSPYRQELEAWGGQPPYRWRLHRGALPPGLSLEPGGEITGTPERRVRRVFEVEVTDASVSPATGRPQSFIQKLSLVVGR